jgi:pimeloyl-ACP methyl ester carboxylesterase
MSAKDTRKKKTIGGCLITAALGTPVAAAFGWIAYSKFVISHNMPLPPAVSGEQRTLYGRDGELCYYVAGTGRPLLLVHSINAAASSYEMRPFFEHYRHTHRVYSLDLPGFGFSSRTDKEYTPRLYTDAILDMLSEIERDAGTVAVDAIALSLGGEFLTRAASECPARLRSLALISPTAFRAGEQFYGPPGSIRGNPAIRDFFQHPLWNRPFYDFLNTRTVQRYFLNRVFGSSQTVDPGLIEYDFLTAHQPGAQYAPYSFVSGLLFSADIDHVYDAITHPVWVAYGLKGDFSNLDEQKVTARSGWSVQSFPTGSMPHFEQPDQVFAAYDQFISQLSGT